MQLPMTFWRLLLGGGFVIYALAVLFGATISTPIVMIWLILTGAAILIGR